MDSNGTNRFVRRKVAKTSLQKFNALKKMQKKAEGYQKEFLSLTQEAIDNTDTSKFSENKKKVFEWFKSKLKENGQRGENEAADEASA